MPTFPLPTLSAAITAAGISTPPYNDIYTSLRASFQLIYGTDAYLDPDSQDGQLLAVFARAVDDCNKTAVSVYNSFSPATAQAAALSNNVALNGIARKTSTSSQVNLLVVGAVGTIILNGKVSNSLNTVQWAMPASVVIPVTGQVLVPAVCEQVGAVAAASNTLTSIQTPTLGWQTVTNPAAAAVGAQIETDAQLRLRQAQSTALPSRTVLAGTLGAVQAVVGVTEAAIYENDTGAVNTLGLPAHSICVVALGGAPLDIATAIALKKTPGAATFGTTSVPVADPASGNVSVINYFVPTPLRILVQVTWTPLAGFTSTVQSQVAEAIAAYINALPIGVKVDIAKLYLPAQLFGGDGASTFNVNSVSAAYFGSPQGTTDLPVNFNEYTTCVAADVTFVLG